jgi:CheY-like chemotaxis protein
MAEQRSVCLCTDLPDAPAVLSTDPVIAEQVLVSVLSHAVQQAHPGDMHLSLKAQQDRATLSMCYYLPLTAEKASTIDLVAMRLIDRLGWKAKQEDLSGGPRTVTLNIFRRGPTILVIDDNQGLVALIERFLADHSYRVIPAANGQAGLRLAQELLPDAIVLDVMMPEMPGWEVLQRLRNHPKTAALPVIVCSVFNDPELAYSLGASSFLSKPVSREDILDALHQLKVE